MGFPHRIETDRMVLRLYRSQDIDSVVEIMANWEVTQWLSTNIPFPFSRVDGEAHIKEAISDFNDGTSFRYAIEDTETARFIGSIRVFSLTEETEIGYSVHPDFWGKGLGTEMLVAAIGAGFETGVIKCFFAMTASDNHGSRRILEKVGFRHVGSPPPALQRCGHGQGCSEYFRLTKEDW